jgi:hypothetical protein
MPENWIDTHSVTCILCDGLADERRTVKVNHEQEEHLRREGYDKKANLIRQIIEANGEGEAHDNCFDVVFENDLDPSGVDLEPLDHR